MLTSSLRRSGSGAQKGAGGASGVAPSDILSLSETHTHSLLDTHTLSLSLAHTHSLSLTHTLSLSKTTISCSRSLYGAQVLELKKELEEHQSSVPGVKERTELVALVQVSTAQIPMAHGWTARSAR